MLLWPSSVCTTLRFPVLRSVRDPVVWRRSWIRASTGIDPFALVRTDPVIGDRITFPLDEFFAGLWARPGALRDECEKVGFMVVLAPPQNPIGLARQWQNWRRAESEAGEGYSINPAVFKALRGLAYDDDDGLGDLPSAVAPWAGLIRRKWMAELSRFHLNFLACSKAVWALHLGRHGCSPRIGRCWPSGKSSTTAIR
jgi:hypothetical protein